MAKKSSLRLLLLAFSVRILVIFVGDLFDIYLYPLQFTDIDYHVYSNAALLVSEGRSPYHVRTYRYPPLLAWLLAPNIYLHRSFGKLLFALFDTLWVYEVNAINQLLPESSIPWNLVCALNPISIYICSRGSSDAISNYFALLSLRMLLFDKIAFAGSVLGFVIYLRIYPIIYVPAFVLYLFYQQRQSSVWRNITKIVNFLVALVVSAGCWTVWSYAVYGQEYLDQAILYHLQREDHRHNFAMHFLSIYYKKSQAMLRQQCDWNPPFDIVSFFLKVLPTVCQVMLLLIVVFKYAANNLPKCMLLQTMVFVSFNKVITGQYFLWYFALVPIVCHDIIQRRKEYICAGSVWIITLCIWLLQAYRLEFLGHNTFKEIYFASVLFLFANVYCIYMVARS